MTSLFQLAAEYKQISDKLNESSLDEQTIIDTLEGASGEIQEKAINVAKYFRNIESDADQIEQAAKQMLDRAKTLRNTAASVKKYLHDQMEVSGISKIECPYFVISLKKNPASVVVDDESLIPLDYMREIPAKHEPDKKLIKSAIDDGFVVPGCRLNHSTRLDVK